MYAIEEGYSNTIIERKRFYRVPNSNNPALKELLAQIKRWAGNASIQGCIPGNSTIFVKDIGYTTIDKIGPRVITLWNGNEFSTGQIVYTGKKELYKIELNNGLKFESSPDHKFLVFINEKEQLWLSAKELSENINKNWQILLSKDPNNEYSDNKKSAIKSIENTGKLVPMFDIVDSTSGTFMFNGVISHNSNADILKIAMVAIYKALRGGSVVGKKIYDAWISLVVHDEIMMICAEKDIEPVKEIMTKCMNDAYYDIIPRPGQSGWVALGTEKNNYGIKIEVAKNWAEAH